MARVQFQIGDLSVGPKIRAHTSEVYPSKSYIIPIKLY